MLDIDPDFALQSRLSFGRGARYAWVLTAAALFLGFNGLSFDALPAVAFDRAGSFLLLAALPYGAIQVRTLERHGHLDARRLTGRSPAALGLALVGGSAGALLFASAALLLVGWVGGQTLPAFTLAALLALGVAMALVLLLLPASTHVDSWILLVLLLVGVVSTVHVMRDDRAVALGVVIVSALIIPWALPIALRRVRGAQPQAAGPPASPMRPLVHLQQTTRPEAARGLLSSGTSLAAAANTALAGALSIAWMTARWDPGIRDLFEVLVVYGPLLLAGYDSAGRVQHERLTGGLDRIRLSGQASWRVVVDMAFALSLPFVAVSIVCAAVLAVIDPRNAPGILRHWPIAAGVLIFWPLIGAFRGRQPGLYMAASVLLAFALGRHGAPWAPGVVAVATAVACATLSLDRTGGMPVDMRMAVAGAASIAAIVASVAGPAWNGLVVAALLSIGAGLLVPDGIRVPGRVIVAGAAAAAVAAGLAEYFWAGGSFALGVQVFKGRSGTFLYPVQAWRGLYSGIVGLYAAAGLVFGYCAWNRFPNRALASFTFRAIPLTVAALLLLTLDTRLAFFANENFMRDYGYNGFAILELVVLVVLAAAAAILAWQDRASIRARTLRS
jgi:hypothetical protein